MATCYRCKSKTGMVLLATGWMNAKAPGTYSLAGAAPKLAAQEVYELQHPDCGWSVQGTVEHGYLIPLPDWEPNQRLGGDDDPATG